MDGALVPGAVRTETPEERLERWMNVYGDAVLHTCFVCLSDVHLAEDAMQDTFVKAWKAMGRLENKYDYSEKAWLLRIAINTCNDYRRGMWFRRITLPGALDNLPPALIAVSPKERETFLVVLSLSPKYRQVIQLHYYENMNLREMSAILGLSVSSVHHRLKKTEETLRRELEGGNFHETK